MRVVFIARISGEDRKLAACDVQFQEGEVTELRLRKGLVILLRVLQSRAEQRQLWLVFVSADISSLLNNSLLDENVLSPLVGFIQSLRELVD